MPSDLTIALDAMGGDFGCSEIIPAALFSLKKYEQLNIVLVGKEDIRIKFHTFLEVLLILFTIQYLLSFF